MIRGYMRTCIVWCTFLLLGMSPALAQSGSISGTIIDEADGQVLIGANVLVIESSGNQLTGAATSIDGTYRIDNVPAGTYTIRARFVGFQVTEQSVTIRAGETLTLDFVMSEEGFELNTVVVTGSRREEKVLDAPASISVLTAEEVASDVSMSSIEALRSTTGIDMAQTGVDRREVVLRGFNNAFSGAAYVMTDYRKAAVASLAVNIYSIMPNNSIDVERVEVVRGPGSALYGPGVDSGVIHFITKDPFTHPGLTVSAAGGERNYFGGQLRYAGVAGGGKLGYKFVGAYSQADEWEMDPTDPDDAAQLRDDLIERRTDFTKYNANLSLEYRFNENTSLIANAGQAGLTSTVLSGIGTLQADGFGYSYGQLRLQAGEFFAQAYINKNEAGDSFVYAQDYPGPGGAAPDGIPDAVTDKGYQLTFQTQYTLDMGQKQNFIIGADADLTRPDTEGTILGRNEANDDIDEFGAYVQSQTAVHRKLDLVAAIRGDYNNVVDKWQVSPRLGIVYKATINHSMRATYNRAFSSPGTNSNFLDIIASTGSAFDVRGRGSGRGFTWQRDPSFAALAGYDLVATSFLPNRFGETGAVGADLDAVYELVYGSLAQLNAAGQLTPILQAQGLPVNDAVVGQLVQLLSPGATQVDGFSRGVLAMLDLTAGSIGAYVDDLEDIQPLAQTSTNTIELGYKGVFAERLLVTVDGYYTSKKNFQGPLLLETPLVIAPYLANDLEAALTVGIANNAALAGALGSLGLSPEVVSNLIVTLAAGDLPSAVGIVQPLENQTAVGAKPELMLTYRNFGKLDYYGLDIGMEYLAGSGISFSGNLSFVSDDFFDNEELDETNEDLALALNAPAFKARFGAKYKSNTGFSVNASFRHVDTFPISSGPYQGMLPSYSLFDLGFGYDFGSSVPGLKVDIGVNNALDNEHRQFIGAPQLGRMGIARLTYSM